ncbi:MAG: PIG-L family deacetylase, partial [Terriglobia bacterium]
MRIKHTFLAVLLAALLAGAAALRAETTEQLETQLKRLPRLATLVYVTAHPDDESAAILTYLARGLHARAVLLCMTRGEGGQNQEGPELGEELGRVRSAELQRAVAGYGAEVRFLGAEDFGYSKSLEETLAFWDVDALLERLVWQIRTLRPLAVISHWSGERAAAGKHHQAAGVLTRRAFVLAADPEAFPQHFQQGLIPWQARTLLVRTYDAEGEQLLDVPVQQPSPVPGKTYEELGWEGFQQHRSQGMHRFNLSDVPFRRHYNLRVAATLRDGPPAPVNVAELAPDLAALPDLFPTVGFPETTRAKLAQAVELAERARRQLGEQTRDEAALSLVQGAGILAGLLREFSDEESTLATGQALAWVEDKKTEYLRTAAALAGVKLLAQSDRAAVSPGEQVWVRLGIQVEAPAVLRAAGFHFGALRLQTPLDWHVEALTADSESATPSAEFMVSIPEGLDPRRLPA